MFESNSNPVRAARVLLIAWCLGATAGWGTNVVNAGPAGEPMVAGGTGQAPEVSGMAGSGTGRTFFIPSGPDATFEMIGAMIQAAPGDVIEFGCGYFELTSTLQLTNTEDVLIKGCGIDQTVLSFKNNASQEGILLVNVRGVVIEDLTVLDTAGNGFELRAVDDGTLRRVRALWSSGGGRQSADPITAANFADRLHVPCTDPPTQDPTVLENALGDTTSPDYTVSPKSGRYGIYPVSSQNILVEDSESVGASDAGIYVGQTTTAIIRNSRAAYNVFGFEIENVIGGEYDGNLAECNTGGFLIYDLDNLRQYGDRSRMYGNISRNNNTYNFTSGGFVGNVPPGSGMITLSYDRIDIFDNLFENNDTGGIIHVSYELFPEGAGRPSEKRIDWYTEGVHIFNNTFVNNGNRLPIATTSDLQNGDVARLLPALVGLKTFAACLDPRHATTCAPAAAAPIVDGVPAVGDGSGTLPVGLKTAGFRGAHIVWDGLLDVYDADCEYPLDENGDPVAIDDRGKPLHSNDDPNPSCHYNGYKFDTASAGAPRIVPDWWASCIEANNRFSDDSITFSNFHGLKGLEPVVAAALAQPGPDMLTAAVAALPETDLENFAASFDLAPHRCEIAYGSTLPPLEPVTIPPFERSGDYDPAPSDERVQELCGAPVAPGAVNYPAYEVNCPTLDQYDLFSDPQDPTSPPNGGGIPFVLNTKLFSDYTVKYRVAFLPPDEAAVWRDGPTNGANATLGFPVGTILAKTFAAEDAGALLPIETRLLIKRQSSSGLERWDGVVYIWEDDGTGGRTTRLAMGGGVADISWDLIDVDSGVRHTGSTSAYSIPHANQCLSCHANEDKTAGAAPIGPKVRFMNRAYSSESIVRTGQGAHPIVGENQLQAWIDRGLLVGAPALAIDANGNATNAPRNPTYNKPGDAGHPGGSPEDIEARTRSWLEVNCQHCHNSRGFAANTGYYLDVFRAVDTTYGICKGPTATGHEGSDGRTVDVYPGDALRSILEFRISPAATSPAARMPPLARSVVDEEAHALVTEWIDTVVNVDESKYPGSSSCTSN